MKLKTRKGIAKRFRLTKTGKIKYGRAGKSHLLTKKKRKKKRSLRKAGFVGNKKNRQRLTRLLP